MSNGTSVRVCVACRMTRLSRYNPDSLCEACQRAACDSTDIAPTWLWDSATLRAALARADIPAVIALLRAASGLSQDDLGFLVGKTQSTISLAERGQRGTFFHVHELLAFVDAVGMPRTALAPLILGRADATLDEATSDQMTPPGDAVDRREFHGLAVGLLTMVALPAAPPPARVDIAHIRHLQAAIQGLRDRGRIVGGRAILRDAVSLFRRARTMLDDSEYTEATGRQLLALTADLGLVAGWQAYDSGDQQLARHLYGEAELLTGSVGDDELAVHLFVNMAQQSIQMAKLTQRRGLAREGLRLVERAADHARREPSPKLHAVVQLRRALAHAQLGDAIAFRASLSAARRELDRGEHPSDPAWARFIRPSEITGYEAMGLQRLGDLRRVADLYHDVLVDQDRSPRDRAFYRAALASALLAKGDHSSAVAEGLRLLPELDDGRMTSTRVLRELRPIRDAASAEADGAEFRTRFDAAAQTLSA
ncbi:helix-turn-helix transcriptional regulator [Spirillospora sp. NPDC047279]|uniref:helix-turn-helix transcriptional regulator n=1 Tax=Spirillospora sp. NPDC047279 TaxID=3155478 RepID=UPI0033D62703